MKIVFTGDVFLGGDLHRFHGTPVQIDWFHRADLRVINLEQAMGSDLEPADKGTLYTSAGQVGWLSTIGADAVGLANNHVHDLGESGVASTRQCVEAAGHKAFGAGGDLQIASRPVELVEGLFILGYCDFDRPHLRQVQVATSMQAGVNPLRFEKIMDDLAKLPDDAHAILFLHWGKEHVWFPPAHDVELARALLADPRVVTVIGMHAHRVQGMLQLGEKSAYMCLGNFLFPNFHIKPPVQLVNSPTESPRWVTRSYHRVFALTYKRWRWVNRVSLVVELDTDSLRTRQRLVVQADHEPIVTPLTGFTGVAFRLWLAVLSSVLKLPVGRYDLVAKVADLLGGRMWRLGVIARSVRQAGVVASVTHLLRARLERGKDDA